MRLLKRAAGLLACLAVAVPLVACDSSGSVKSFDTEKFEKYAQTSLTMVQYISTYPGVSDKLSDAQKKELTDDVATAQKIVAQIAQLPAGSVSIDTASSLGHQLEDVVNDVLKIGGPILEILVPSSATYVAAAQQLVILIEDLLPTVSMPTAHAAINERAVIARIDQGA